MVTETDLVRAAADTGFLLEPIGKVERLLALLEGLRSHPFLKGRVVLKGGTALNLFVFDVPRLSVDIDLNYVGAADRATMLEERPKIEQAIQAVCGRLGIGFIVYGGINRRDWREVSLDDVQTSVEDVDRRLIPMLRADIAPPRDQISSQTPAATTCSGDTTSCRSARRRALSITVDNAKAQHTPTIC